MFEEGTPEFCPGEVGVISASVVAKVAAQALLMLLQCRILFGLNTC